MLSSFKVNVITTVTQYWYNRIQYHNVMEIKIGIPFIPFVMATVLCLLLLCVNGIDGFAHGQRENNDFIWGPWWRGHIIVTSYKDVASLDFNHNSPSNLMWRFIIAKGCAFVMGFVKNTYATTSYSQDEADWDRLHPMVCENWKFWLKGHCHLHSVPRELCCGLIHCGKVISLVAMGAPLSTLEQCNVSTSASELLIGKRDSFHNDNNFEPEGPGGEMCANFEDPVVQNDEYFLQEFSGFEEEEKRLMVSSRNQGIPFIARSVKAQENVASQDRGFPRELQDRHAGGYGQHEDKAEFYLRLMFNRNVTERVNVTESSTSPSTDKYGDRTQSSRKPEFIVYSHSNSPDPPSRITQAFLMKKSKHWCKRLAKEISNAYSIVYSTNFRRSKYWLVDTYKMAGIIRLPTSVTNGLVGCGVHYVMKAFRVSGWEQFLYSIADERSSLHFDF